MGRLVLVVEDQDFELDKIDPDVYDESSEDDLFMEYDTQISQYLTDLEYHLEYEED